MSELNVVVAAGLGALMLSCAGCSAHTGPSTTVWLTFEEGEQSSRYMLSVTTSGYTSVSAEGPLVKGTRSVGQTSQMNLSDTETKGLAALFGAAEVSAYEADREQGVDTSAASERAFVVFLDDKVPDAPVSRGMLIGFRDAAVLKPETRTLVHQLNQTLRSVWIKGAKQGPTAQIAEPPQL